ncbi:conserved protein of unknown function [Clostridium phage phiCD24-1]|nr:conserved protein of unknown function [Clostridium phage phiCD24-1]
MNKYRALRFELLKLLYDTIKLIGALLLLYYVINSIF